ncbi:PadR family transcriptional regulator [Clavibacter zhangzhiyongii]|uniref:PadR family transcriptional regulator n=1 Tax=Clavibacter zhangzhiyongii TaxID=2768071 RepID=A0A7L7Z3H6_9MICO|nr:PadR family transcriptional regulator [Clavibacter zhangzhiyongii]QOD44209.1 PadR family transcriptional regulator [Clavibacter zhangzhiyongii]
MDTTQLLKGALDTAVLAVVQHDDGYGYDIVRRLRDAGLGDVGDASVYGTLRRLYAAGALSSYVVPSEGGPHRKYYAINPEGRELLAGQRATWAAFATAMSGLLGEAAAHAHRTRKAGGAGEGAAPAPVNVRTIGDKP